MPNPMRTRPTSHEAALFVKVHSTVCKSEIDTSNRTFRIRFFAHPRVVPGWVVVNGISEGTGEENTQSVNKFPKRTQMKYMTRRSMWSRSSMVNPLMRWHGLHSQRSKKVSRDWAKRI